MSKIVGPKNATAEPSELYLYSMTPLIRYQHMPDAVVRPKVTEQVSALLKLVNEKNIPVTPRGAGSNMAGGAVPIKGGLVLDMSSMDKILEIDLNNHCVVVQPGVVLAVLNEELRKHGFFFPPDPSSNKVCTLGGLVAVGGGGAHAVKYSTVREYVLGLTVVLSNGNVIKTGGKTIKRATGYNLTQLFIGSEGTLGVITEIILKVIPLPETRSVIKTAFNDLEVAARAVNVIFKNGIIPAALEILDNSAIKAVNKYKPQINLPEVNVMLLIEVDGSKDDVRRQAQAISQICLSHGAVDVEWSDNEMKCAELWEGRNVVGVAASRLIETYSRVYEGEDITVPISKVADAVRGIKKISEKHNIPIVIFGHIGDGNLHPAILIDKKKNEHWKLLDKVIDEIHELALDLGGTVSGEHGIGILRAKYMERENGPIAMDIMRKIKKVFDPKGIMNPGKLDLEA
ncbi:FAD-binding protein [Candidatus Bathyarchaeota archaeon]|nr:FAD-binding protein [Candidatus Bathyarchaeota archaeon]